MDENHSGGAERMEPMGTLTVPVHGSPGAEGEWLQGVGGRVPEESARLNHRGQSPQHQLLPKLHSLLYLVPPV